MLTRKAQSVSEYALLLATVIGVVASMNYYVGRSLKAKNKDVIDAVATAYSSTYGKTLAQYEPYYSKSDITTNEASNVQGSYASGENTYSSGNIQEKIGERSTTSNLSAQ